MMLKLSTYQSNFVRAGTTYLLKHTVMYVKPGRRVIIYSRLDTNQADRALVKANHRLFGSILPVQLVATVPVATSLYRQL